MAHTVQERRKLLARVNRLQGQLESIRVAIEEEKECATVLQQIAACRGAINSLLVEIIDGEIRFHVLSKNSKMDSREARAAENLVEILHRYIK
ncbi:MAG: metal/formaldehyde-sensitive transcriptional repressor [Acidobacteria bacterium]|nr:metal/formaldehyde-sensitive transcriptional repressor [Acidobacteriota bacterium]MBS1867048.1 metal/formaldehyde-sensitive transcriptional repressor [Acidobacteriota bacterium]